MARSGHCTALLRFYTAITTRAQGSIWGLNGASWRFLGVLEGAISGVFEVLWGAGSQFGRKIVFHDSNFPFKNS